MVEIFLISACIALVLLPPKWDLAIIIKEFQMGHRDRKSFARGMKNAILPSLAAWAAIAFIAWIVFLK